MKKLVMAAMLAGSMFTAPAAKAVDIEAYIKQDTFNAIKISPNGDYYAATVPLEDRTALTILRRADNVVTASFQLGKNRHVEDFDWVSPDRVLYYISEKFGALDQPQWTGEIFAISANGSNGDLLVGQRVQGEGLGSRIQPKKAERVAAFLVDDLPDDDDNVIISVIPFTDDPFTRAQRMDVNSGRRAQVASAPVRRADFTTDSLGVVRFAAGAGTDNSQKLYYRSGDDADWELINDEDKTGLTESPIGFSAGDKIAYFIAERTQGPDAIIAYDIETRERSDVLRDDTVDPARILYRNGTGIPVGVQFIDGKPRTAFFDDASPEARLYRSLEAAFGDDPVLITSQTSDGRTALVQTWSDRSPGDFYVFDTVAKKADHLLSQRQWFDPAQMAGMRPIQLKARDGLALHGYLTVPNGSGGDSDGKNLPMVVMPHGGPFEVQDVWGFNNDVQMLAQAGYAVLQVNFRGSGGYGNAFHNAGARQWGKAMQDDVTDATRWAIQQGIADRDRICIYGASYGAYAALMGVAREPDLYQCAVGYVGVYDLPTMHTNGDIQERGSGQTYLREWLGEREQLGAVSPNRMAERIKVPVFLAAGGEDERTPIVHSELMERALRNANVPVETLYYDTEGHGFYVEKNRREYYTRLLAFLARSLGGKTAQAGGGASDLAE